jgi:hypothetical protein
MEMLSVPQVLPAVPTVIAFAWLVCLLPLPVTLSRPRPDAYVQHQLPDSEALRRVMPCATYELRHVLTLSKSGLSFSLLFPNSAVACAAAPTCSEMQNAATTVAGWISLAT